MIETSPPFKKLFTFIKSFIITFKLKRFSLYCLLLQSAPYIRNKNRLNPVPSGPITMAYISMPMVVASLILMGPTIGLVNTKQRDEKVITP
jgi:hypothetical protein